MVEYVSLQENSVPNLKSEAASPISYKYPCPRTHTQIVVLFLVAFMEAEAKGNAPIEAFKPKVEAPNKVWYGMVWYGIHCTN